ncbi:unnamed protein product, partial [Medioppia subpectinata]
SAADPLVRELRQRLSRNVKPNEQIVDTCAIDNWDVTQVPALPPPRLPPPPMVKGVMFKSHKHSKGANNKQLLELYGSSELATKFIKVLQNPGEKEFEQLCDKAKYGRNQEIMHLYREINEMNSDMKEYRDGFTSAMADAAKLDTKLRHPDVLCIKKNKNMGFKILMELYGTSPLAAQFLKFMKYSDSEYVTICDKLKYGENEELMAVYRQFNEKNSEFKLPRERLTNALVDVANSEGKYKIGDILCFLIKFNNEIKVIVTGDAAREALKEWLFIYRKYIALNGHTPSTSCDWSHLPTVDPPVRSLHLLLCKALKNVDKHRPTPINTEGRDRENEGRGGTDIVRELPLKSISASLCDIQRRVSSSAIDSVNKITRFE